MPSPTIIDLKSAFLRTQVFDLSRPLHPSADWVHMHAAANDNNALRQKHVADALLRLNALLRTHNRVVYTPQGVRHVAEQIDALYWGAEDRDGAAALGARADPSKFAGDGEDRHWLAGAGLDASVENLPEAEDVGALDAQEAERYEAARRRLEEASARRREARARAERLRVLKGLLKPFADPKNDVQVNLCTRDGELGKELERMKVLLLRVGARVGALEGEAREDVMIGDEKGDLDRVLELMGVD